MHAVLTTLILLSSDGILHCELGAGSGMTLLLTLHGGHEPEQSVPTSSPFLRPSLQLDPLHPVTLPIALIMGLRGSVWQVFWSCAKPADWEGPIMTDTMWAQLG